MISSIGSGASSGQAAAMAQMRSQMFTKSDTDASGGLDATEFQALVSHGPGGQRDASSVEADFKSFDSDSDGSLSQAELEAGFEQKMQAFRSTVDSFGGAEGAGGPGGPGGPPPGPPPQGAAGAEGSDSSTSSTTESTDEEDDPLATLLAALENNTAASSRVATALRDLLRGLTGTETDTGTSTSESVSVSV
jgi:hypothetical protein